MNYIIDVLSLLANVTYKYIFIPFAVWNMLYLVIKTFHKKNWIVEINELGLLILKYAGLFYLVFFFLITGILICNSEAEPNTLENIVGRNWRSYWVNPLLWIFCTQVIRSKFVSNSFLLRFLISIVLLVSIEYYIIFMTTLVRDYPELNYSLLHPISHYFILLLKGIIFIVVCKLLMKSNREEDKHVILDEKINEG